MAENSKIEWTDDTANLWIGCTKVHAGCKNCYAEELMANRYKNVTWGEGVPRKRLKKWLTQFTTLQNKAKKEGTTRKVFVGSLMDIFEKPKLIIDHQNNELSGTTGDLRDVLFSKIDTNEYPNLIFLFLTKRPSNINKYIPENWKKEPPKNVWYGCSPVDQKTYNNFFGHMMQVRGTTFYSIEPQLANIIINSHDKINWIIQGGESGRNRRPFNLDWATSLRRQCEIYQIPYFFKQIDKVKEIPKDMLVRQFPEF